MDRTELFIFLTEKPSGVSVLGAYSIYSCCYLCRFDVYYNFIFFNGCGSILVCTLNDVNFLHDFFVQRNMNSENPAFFVKSWTLDRGLSYFIFIFSKNGLGSLIRFGLWFALVQKSSFRNIMIYVHTKFSSLWVEKVGMN